MRQAEQKIRAEEKRINEIEQEIEDIAETDEKGITADERLWKNLTNYVSENFPTEDAPEEENDNSDGNFMGYVISPSISGLDDLTPNSFQFNGGNMVVVDSRIKKYPYEPTIFPDVSLDQENTHQMVVNGFGVTLDSGQYLDTTLTSSGDYDYTSANHRVSPSSGEREVSIDGGVSWDGLGVTPVISNGVQTGINVASPSYFESNAFNQPQTIQDPHTVIFEEK